ncbi:predicted protein [Naegleria gruberi]|uniref:Predicted protein n=1 Tax=Naegleria gruberi TaxID=5762 RepID=D2VI38_NAEGR|nr:uncharacterized protein NAEGRDRAFT_68549 [Naegleria gruberi]EFC43448.1 predicted protein [Naegleria gruberi]|eukprot:XP_002676192.1 predicted protein [Naegleria gruberi strain NEG-M]
MKVYFALCIAVVLCLVNFGICQGDRYIPSHPLDQYNKPADNKHQAPNALPYYPYMPIYIPQFKAPEYKIPEPPKYTIPEAPKAPQAPWNYLHNAPSYYAQPFNSEEFKKYMPDWLNAKPLHAQQPKDFPKFPQFPQYAGNQHQYGQQYASPYAPQDWNEFFKKQYPWTEQYNAFPWSTQKQGFAKPLKSVGSISESDNNVSGDESETI